MSNRAWIRLAARTALLVAGWGSWGPAPARLVAQVGHDPEHSPYRDLRVTHQLTVSAGFLAGGGGRVGVGPKQGPVAGIRYAISLSGPLEFTFALHAAQLERQLIDTAAPPDRRLAGTGRQAVMIGDAGFTLRLTGAKTWHGLLPYVGGSLGVAQGGSLPEDRSGFEFIRPFQFGPHLGARYYGTGAVSFWVELWDPIWRLRYPQSWALGTAPLLASGDPLKQWVHNPTLLVGLGFTLRK